ncbi:hypothetical protein HYW75_06780 [Candidatus Pacearchaeota archaeon]|nr:hypothetical protein [Candidatus Pacearchaeota archaeon]
MAGQAWMLIVLIVIIVIVVLKVVNKKQSAAVKLTVILFLFLMATVGYVIVTKDVNLTSPDGIVYAGKVYVNWLGNIFKNIGKVSSFAINQNWAINSTNITAP